jgi:hypothetical protein
MPPTGPWGMHYSSRARPNGPAQVAAIWQLVIGGILLLAGTCFGAVAWLAPTNLIEDQMRVQATTVPDIPGWSSAEVLRTEFYVAAGVQFSVGLTLVVLALFVRRGGHGTALASIVFIVLICLVLVLNGAGSIATSGGNPLVLLSLLIIAGLLGLCINTIRKLWEAYRHAEMGKIQSDQWQMMRQQQMAGPVTMWGYPLPPLGAGPVGESSYYAVRPPAAAPTPQQQMPNLPPQQMPSLPPPQIPPDNSAGNGSDI